MFKLSFTFNRKVGVAITASVLLDDKRAAEKAGMQGFANKPIDFTLLSHEIARVLNINVTPSSVIASQSKTDLLLDENKGTALWGSLNEYYRQIESFITSQQEALNKLQNAIATNDWAVVEAITHTLKGISGSLGMQALHLACKAFEKKLNRQSDPLSSTIFLTIFEQTLSVIKNYVANNQKQDNNSVQFAAPKLLDQ